jgi:protein SCO1/2
MSTGSSRERPVQTTRASGRFVLVAAMLALWLASMLLPLPNLGAWFASMRAPDPPPPATTFQAGTPLDGQSAPSFALHDQDGAPIALDQFRGKPVVLTFLDSVCPHTDCSLMAQYLQWGAQLLGGRTSDVAWVALSVNPWHDTPAMARAFVASHGVTFPLHYLLGSVSEMTALWSAYHMQAVLQSDGIVIHTTGVYLLDKQGREREFLDEGFDPHAFAADLGKLLAETGPTAASGAGQPSLGGGSSQSLNVGGDTIAFSATPGQYGSYVLGITLRDGRGAPVEGATVTADLIMADMVMEPEHIVLASDIQAGAGVYSARGVLTMAGPWQARIHIQFAAGPVPLPGMARVTLPLLAATFAFATQF